ncbi:hypothetical protein CDL15_Pgr005868 [Punica granatum]|uniref:Uncharacterized protein n=1 Tax=Punica granatum TaxID=22663 RepID=A0A218WH53_PUNGR|nr:hypothetical protein CDL15_Pgr005868 [Punica granatum]PKI41344.1 hypothetical protein CRG98_038230 [Punica granatum]
MGSRVPRNKLIDVLFIAFLILSISSFKQSLALRPLGIMESLRRAPAPPSQSSACTYIPGGGGRGRCVLSERNYMAAGSKDDHTQGAATPAAMPASPDQLNAANIVPCGQWK